MKLKLLLSNVAVSMTMVLCASSAFNAQAGESKPVQNGDAWKYELTVYGWFPAIGGESRFPSGSGSSINVSTEQVVDALQFAFMGNFGVKKGAWGAWTDVAYSKFNASKSGSRDFSIGNNSLPANVNADVSLDIKAWIWTLAGTYELSKSSDFTADVLVGARLFDMQQTLDWSLQGDIGQVSGIGRNGSANADVSVWDGVVGVKGAAYLGSDRKWFIPYYLDIGTGQSDLTWQVNAGLGYQFDWGALVATWRYLDYSFPSDKAVQSVDFSGATIGATLKW